MSEDLVELSRSSCSCSGVTFSVALVLLKGHVKSFGCRWRNCAEPLNHNDKKLTGSVRGKQHLIVSLMSSESSESLVKEARGTESRKLDLLKHFMDL